MLNPHGEKIGEIGTPDFSAESTEQTFQIAPNEHVYGLSMSVDLS